MNLLKTAKRSRMGNELVPIAHADGRVQPGQRRGLERPYIQLIAGLEKPSPREMVRGIFQILG